VKKNAFTPEIVGRNWGLGNQKRKMKKNPPGSKNPETRKTQKKPVTKSQGKKNKKKKKKKGAQGGG